MPSAEVIPCEYPDKLYLDLQKLETSSYQTPKTTQLSLDSCGHNRLPERGRMTDGPTEGQKWSNTAVKMTNYTATEQSNPYITNGCVQSCMCLFVQSRVMDNVEIERDNLVCDGRELVVEAESIGTTDVSIPLKHSSLFSLDIVNRLVVWRRNFRVNVKIAATYHLRIKQIQYRPLFMEPRHHTMSKSRLKMQYCYCIMYSFYWLCSFEMDA